MTFRTWVLGLALVFISACSSGGSDNDTACDPHDALTRVCACESAATGLQTCKDGSWSPCVCGQADGDVETLDGETLDRESAEAEALDGDKESGEASEADLDAESAADHENETAEADSDITEESDDSQAVSEDGDSEADSEAESEAESEIESESDTSGLPSFPPTRVACSDASSDWIERFGNTGADWGQDLHRMANGDLILLGYYDGKIEFDSGFLLPVAGMPVPGFFAHFNAQGRSLSAKDLSADFATTYTSVLSMSEGPLGRLFFSSLVPENPDGDLRLLVGGYDADGTRLTAFSTFLSGYTTSPAVLAMAVDDTGATYIADTAAVRKLDTAGQELWSKPVTYNDGYWADMESVLEGSRHFNLVPRTDGGAVLWGIAQNKVTANNMTLNFSSDPASPRSGVFTLTISFSSGYQGFSAGGSSSTMWGGDVATSSAGEKFWSFACSDACARSSKITVGPGAILLKVAADGTLAWVKVTTDTFDPHDAYPLALDGNGNLFQAGGGSIRKLDGNGNVVGLVATPSWLKVRSLQADEAGGVYATGSFAGTVYMFCGALESAGETSQHESDVFLAHFSTFPAPSKQSPRVRR